MEDGSPQGIVRKLKSVVRRLTNGFSAEHFEEEIQGLIDQGAERGVISPGESEMLQSIFELGETVAREIMIPRTSMVAVSTDATLGQAMDIILTNGHTRLPVYDTDIDHIVGILIAKDLLPYWGRSADEPLPREIIRPPILAPEVKKIMDLLAELKAKKSHMAIILDEYGGTAGLVTLEDIIEEIVGDIADEHDVDVAGLRQEADGSVVVDGSVPIRDINRALDWDLPDEEATTIAGLVIHEAQTIPAEKQAFTFHGKRFVVMKREKNRITKLRIRPV